ncbi:MAG TPA: glycosyltransferase family 39 protein [Acidimicrobiales bacterium]|nr:glycosyltransferase family 39 protein [Acidimicrobiales bacterium]
MVVVAVYAVTIALLPAANVPIADDWVYARSVRGLVEDLRFEIVEASVATLVFHIAWGALFASVLGMSFDVLRLSTVVLTATSALALYGLCRALHVSPPWSALAAAAWLFNPLGYVLANSFMTDASFAALMVIATFLYVRGLDEERETPRVVVWASAAAAAAFLVRHQGILIPLSVLAYLLLARRLTADRRGAVLAGRVAAVPVATVVVYWLWLNFVHGVPAGQSLFVDGLSVLWGWRAPRFLAELLTVQAMYAGLFVLPVAAAAVVAVPQAVRSLSPRLRAALGAGALGVAVGAGALAAAGRLMPTVPQFFASWGLGPADIRGGRPEVFGRGLQAVLTVAVVVSLVVVAVLVARRLTAGAGGKRGAAGLVASVLAGQVAGVLPPSVHFQIPVPGGILTTTLDRYLLPLLPLSLALAVWATARLRVPAWPAWTATALLGVVAVVGTSDFLRFQRTVWEAAAAANAAGIDNDRLDGGAQWSSEHLYHGWVDVPPPRPEEPWWINLFAWTTDSSYVLATEPQPGYVEVWHMTYRTHLPRRDNPLLLLRRETVPPP